MESVNVARLKASLSAYLAKVKSGEEVVVTERGRPIAKLNPVQVGRGDPDRVRELARQGRIRLPDKEADPEIWGSCPADGSRSRPRKAYGTLRTDCSIRIHSAPPMRCNWRQRSTGATVTQGARRSSASTAVYVKLLSGRGSTFFQSAFERPQP